jgi:hypothetical protein
VSIRVHLPDGRVVNFPDGMPPQEIEKAVSELSGPQQSKPVQAPEGKSVGGFLENLLSSGGKFLTDTVTGVGDVAKLAGKAIQGQVNPVQQMRNAAGIWSAIQNAPQIAGELAKGFGQRYGGKDEFLNTLYTDPVGVLGDISSVASLGAGAATKVPKVAGVLRKVEAATNPLRAIEPAAKAVEYGTAAAVRPMLKPPKGLRRQQRGPLEIERTALTEGAVTEGAAGRKLGQATARTTQATKDATATGATVPKGQIAQFPKTLDETQNLTPNVRELDELAALEMDTNASLPSTLTPDELLARRRALDRDVDKSYRAEERHGVIRTTRDKGKKELADNMRASFRQAVPAAKDSDDLARRLGLVRGSLEESGFRAGDIPMTSALVSGGMLAGGLPGAGTAGALFGVVRNFPQIPLALGSVPVRGTAAAAAVTKNPAARQGLLLSALMERLGLDDVQSSR